MATLPTSWVSLCPYSVSQGGDPEELTWGNVSLTCPPPNNLTLSWTCFSCSTRPAPSLTAAHSPARSGKLLVSFVLQEPPRWKPGFINSSSQTMLVSLLLLVKPARSNLQDSLSMVSGHVLSCLTKHFLNSPCSGLWAFLMLILAWTQSPSCSRSPQDPLSFYPSSAPVQPWLPFPPEPRCLIVPHFPGSALRGPPVRSRIAHTLPRPLAGRLPPFSQGARHFPGQNIYLSVL